MTTEDNGNGKGARAADRVVVVVSHPDDESFGCGSLIASATAAGARVTVVCATRGEAGERVPDPDTDHLALGELREQELRAAAKVLGVDTIELLDLADSGFDGPLPDGALCGVDIDVLAADIAARLERLAATVVVILDGSDGHRDHAHVRVATEIALIQLAPAPRLVEVSIANSLMRRWVEEMRVLHPDTAYLELDVEHLGRPDAELTAIDVADQLAVRERAIACHASQRSPYEGLSPELRRAFLATDFVVMS